MTQDQLRYFCAAAQYGSFSKAAEKEHISQPSLCTAIHKLEKEFSVRLFQTNRRGAILTETGRLFLEQANHILTQIAETEAHMRRIARQEHSELRIAYTSSFAYATVPRLLRNFLQNEGKGCCIYSDEMPSEQIAHGIRDGRFDLGLGSRIPVDQDVEQIPVACQRFCVLTPPGQCRLAETPELFACMPLICYRRDYPMFQNLTRLFDELKIQPDIIHYAYSEAAIARLVEQGLGAAIVAEVEGLDRFELEKFIPAWLTGGREVYLMRHRTRPLPAAAVLLQERILKGEVQN